SFLEASCRNSSKKRYSLIGSSSSSSSSSRISDGTVSSISSSREEAPIAESISDICSADVPICRCSKRSLLKSILISSVIYKCSWIVKYGSPLKMQRYKKCVEININER